MSNTNGNLVIYKSSAGSGKTFTLVNEYVKLLLRDPEDYRRILAITFTNKAANEMKERILKELSRLAESDDNRISTTTKDNAKRALTLIIHNYSEFAVSTIDHFVQRISRIFARDLNISPNYEVELDSSRIMANIVELLISKAGRDKEITETLLGYIRSTIDEESNWRIERSIAKSGETIFSDESAPFIAELKALKLKPKDVKTIRNHINDTLGNISVEVKEIATRACLLIEQNGLQIKDFAQTTKGIAAYFYKLKESGSAFDAHTPNSYVQKAIYEDAWTSKKAQNNGVMDIANSLKNYFYELQEVDKDGLALIYQHVLRNLYNVSLLNEIRILLDEYIADNDIVPISEFNRKINEIIAQEPIPYIYARIGEKYKYILVDEFQDTSKLQWHNLIPLIENSLSNNNFNMIIGDGKQSIYRWRGGDARQFTDLPNINNANANHNYSDANITFANEYNPQNLPYNYRSNKEIINFNNSLYEFIVSNLKIEELSKIYDQQKQLQPSNTNKEDGYVSMSFFDKGAGLESDEWYFNETHEIIKQCLLSGYEYSDIAILCRRNDDNVKISNYLNSNSIPVVSKESLFLKTNTRVRLMISLLSHIANPTAKLPQYEIILLLLSLHPEINRSSILNPIVEGHFNLYSSLKQIGYNLSVSYLQRLSLYDTCEELVRIFNFNKINDPYVITFLNKVHECSTKNVAFIYQFIDWWNENKDSLSLNMPDELNGVQMITVHKSKGLQFPIVIYPFANQKIARTDTPQWVKLNTSPQQPLPVIWGTLSSDLETTYLGEYIAEEKTQSTIDNINVMYVATTRAEDRLYILADKPTNNDVKRINDLIYQYVKSIGGDTKKCEIGTSTVNKRAPTNLSDSQKTNLTNQFISTNWHNNLRAHLTYLDNEFTTEKRNHGILIHQLLSQIITFNDINPVVSQAVEMGTIKDNADSIATELHNIVNSSELSPYFREGLKVKNESEIVLHDLTTIIPDRLVFEGQNVTIIDYKTGSPSESHQKQINHYASVLQQMGYTVVNRIIYYCHFD